MKTQKGITLLFGLAVISGLFFSCEKEGDKNTGCLIITVSSITPSGNSLYSITYDNEGKISTLNSTGFFELSKVFTYSGNTILISTTQGSGTSASTSLDSITIDGQGRPLNIRRYGETRTSWVNIVLEYNGENLSRMLQTTHSSSTPVIQQASSTDGNLMSLSGPAGAETFEYYDDEIQQGDYLQLSMILFYGVNIFPHKNLVKTYTNAGGITNFIYEKNAEGLITGITATSGSTVSEVTYVYKCD